MAENEVRVCVPGRVCLAGEHVDWMGGRVASLCIDLTTDIRGQHTGGAQIDVRYALDFPCERWPADHPGEGWLRPVVDTLRAHGIDPPGCRLTVTGDLPTSGGLASSAALCLALVTSLVELADRHADRDELAQFALEAERLRGVLCGPMDQYGISYGGLTFLDCKSSRPEITCAGWPPTARLLVGTSPQSCLLQSVLPGLLQRHAARDSELRAYRNECDDLVSGMAERPTLAELSHLVNEGQRLAEVFLGPFDPAISRAMTEARRAGALAVKTSGARGSGGSCFAICEADRTETVRQAMLTTGIRTTEARPADGIRVG